ncbi:MAG: glycosyltransferase [Sumerlaeia bacterium]
MKVLFLGEAKKKHVRDWAAWLMEQGVQVQILSDNLPASFEHEGQTLNILQPQWSFLQNLWTYKIRGGELANNRDKWKVYLPYIKQFNPDLIHAHEALGYGPILAYTSKAIPKVLTPWGPDVEDALLHPTTSKGRLVIQACKSADAIVTNANGLEDKWAAGLSIPKSKFHFFTWGVNTAHFKPVSRELRLSHRDQWLLPEEAVLFFCPRIPRPLYRHDLILKAWRKFRAGTNAQPAHLLFLTAGDSAPKKWDKQGIPDFSFIERECSPNEMAQLYQLSTITLMIPKTDLLAQSLLESLACGSIPMVNPLIAYKHVLSHHDDPSKAHGIWVEDESVEPNNGPASDDKLILQLVKAFHSAMDLSPEKRAQLSAHNAAYAAHHLDEKFCRKQMLHVYDCLLCGKNLE